MKDRQREKWEKLRAKGKKKFVIYNGILGWGVPTAILFSLAMTFLDSYSVQIDKEFFKLLIISIILFPFGGIFWGLWVWAWSEKLYKANTNNKVE